MVQDDFNHFGFLFLHWVLLMWLSRLDLFTGFEHAWQGRLFCLFIVMYAFTLFVSSSFQSIHLDTASSCWCWVRPSLLRPAALNCGGGVGWRFSKLLCRPPFPIPLPLSPRVMGNGRVLWACWGSSSCCRGSSGSFSWWSSPSSSSSAPRWTPASWSPRPRLLAAGLDGRAVGDSRYCLETLLRRIRFPTVIDAWARVRDSRLLPPRPLPAAGRGRALAAAAGAGPGGAPAPGRVRCRILPKTSRSTSSSSDDDWRSLSEFCCKLKI